MSKEFVHLHVHSVYSLDSVIRIPDLCRHVEDFGMPAVAVTDHGCLSGAVELRDAAREVGIKPIFGCEIRVSTGNLFGLEGYPTGKRWHNLVLLAENDEGYRNLMRIVSVRRFGELPGELVVDKEFLRQHAKGVIATSGGMKGEIAGLLQTAGEASAERALEEHRGIFGGDRFYLEIQDTGISGQSEINDKLIGLARRTGTPLVATSDCRHLDRNYSRELQIFLCLKAGITISDWKEPGSHPRQDYVQSALEMEKKFGHVSPESLANTMAIAERCNVELKAGGPLYPRYDCPNGYSTEAYLRHLAEDGLAQRLKEKSLRGEAIAPGEAEIYRKRLARELEVVHRIGASAYFLVVWDYVRYAKDHGIPVGPGRGSAPGSLLSFTLRLTDVDPIPFRLHFERFLNSVRNLPPDVDLDFDRDRRPEIVRYLKEKYGAANVAEIATYRTLKGARAIRLVGKVMELPDADVEEIAKMEHGTIDDGIDFEPMNRIIEEGKIELFELAHRAASLEGTVLGVERHPMGIAITDGPVSERVPVYAMGKELVTQFPMGGLSRVGVVPFDLLGLRTLTVIRETIRRIREEKGIEIDIGNIPLDDAATFEMLGRGDAAGVFQCGSKYFLELLRELKPDTLHCLVDAIALYRPKPLQNGTVDEYLKRRHIDPGEAGEVFPVMEDITWDTYGIILYQEQVMDIAARIAGFPMEEADLIRIAVRKGDSEKYRERFVEGGVRNGYPKRWMERVFEQIGREGAYSFCKAHAVGYGLLMYRTAYLKCHWPWEYGGAWEAIEN